MRHLLPALLLGGRATDAQQNSPIQFAFPPPFADLSIGIDASTDFTTESTHPGFVDVVSAPLREYRQSGPGVAVTADTWTRIKSLYR